MIKLKKIKFLILTAIGIILLCIAFFSIHDSHWESVSAPGYELDYHTSWEYEAYADTLAFFYENSSPSWDLHLFAEDFENEEIFLDAFKESIDVSEADIESQQEIIINGHKGYQFVAESPTDNIKGQISGVYNDGLAVIISFVAEKDEFDEHIDRVNRMIDSLRFIEFSQNDQLFRETEDYDFAKSLYYNPEDSIVFRVNPMIEASYLLIEMQKKEAGFTNYPNGQHYFGQAFQEFMEHRDHSVFTILASMVRRGFSYDAVPSAIYYYDDDFNLREDVVMDDFIISRAGGEKRLDHFMMELKAFRMDSGFDDFFRSKEEFYLLSMKGAHDLMVENNVVEVMEAFYGVSVDGSILTITPYSMNNYGVSLQYKDGRVQYLPTVTSFTNSPSSFINLIIHEFSHPFVNPNTAKFPETLEATEALFEPIAKQMASQAYPNWEIAINEHVVRANTLWMIREIFGEKVYEAQLKDDKSRGFIYIDQVLEAIEDYQLNRDLYPTFDDFYPEIMKVFESI